MRIRPAQESDLAAAAALWAERLALLRQSDPAIAPRPEGALIDAARRWIANDERAIFVAHSDAEVLGFIAVAASGPASLAPTELGWVEAMAVDLHRAHPGLSGKLLARAKDWLRGRGIPGLEVTAPAHYPVEEAFWHGQGARLRSRVYWLRT